MPWATRRGPYAKAISPEFRRKVLDLLEVGRTVRRLSIDLQISDQTISNRREQESPDTGRKPGPTSSNRREPIAA